MAAEGLADHVVVSRSEHIPRIQEAQASAYHVLRDLVERPTRGGGERDRRAPRPVRVEGTVQGVGFRPYVYRLAGELGLAGFVLNDSRGVLLEVEGGETAVERFLARLRAEAPPLAVDRARVAEDREPIGHSGSRSSRAGAAARRTRRSRRTPRPATTASRELFDPHDRRFRYPFINCTNCGPRFTIVRGIPYDRPFTTMAGFRMCARCRAEYDDPRDRRFHAQPNACPACGPSVSLLRAGGARAPGGGPGRPPRPGAARRRIVAVKGIGGYHLACRADDEAAVAALRARKHREDKPFALMVASLDAAAALVALGPSERALLAARPARSCSPAPRGTRARGARGRARGAASWA